MEPVVAGQTSGLLAITDLCKSLNEGTDACYGYLTPEKDCKYFVYRVSTRNAETITLENILSGYVRPRPSRRQRYALASILASSFLQFIDTPLLPVTWKKSDIVFLEDINDPNVFALDRPQLLQNLTTIDKGKGRSGPSSAYSNALDMLGIVLLELCFGSLLENQPCRKSWPTGNDDKERQAFELMAAREWQTDVIGEAGPDYAGSVAWCLGGNRSSSADQWRNLMLQNVVNPLKRCHTYLAESEASISLAVNSAK